MKSLLFLRHVKNSRVTLVTELVCCQWYLQMAKARISSPISGFKLFFFFFFGIDLCAPRGTEPYVALREHVHVNLIQ